VPESLQFTAIEDLTSPDTRREVQEDFNVYYFTCRALRWL
jgi:hypothetical protein